MYIPEADELFPLEMELRQARAKFPDNHYMMAALAEEIGELAEAWLENPGSDATRKEAVQVACVAMRIASEPARPEGESLECVVAMRELEHESRKFWATLPDRPDLSARTHHQIGLEPGLPRNWDFDSVEAFVEGNYWHNPADAIGDIRRFICTVRKGLPPSASQTRVVEHIYSVGNELPAATWAGRPGDPNDPMTLTEHTPKAE